MARKPRIHLPGGIYHVIFRGNGGQDVFLTEADRYRFCLLLQEGSHRFGYRIHAFCLMGNHIHLALQVGDIPLSRAMHNLSFRYTRWINWRKQRSGHLFQGRYKAILVDGESYLLELVRYIHLNPVRAGLVVDPEEYSWSGHRAYLGKETLPWLTTDWMLGQFGKSVTKAQAAYMAFVLEGVGEVRRPDFHGAGVDSRLLGDDNFMDRCLSGSGEMPLRLIAQQIIDQVCLAYHIDVSILKAKSQQRTASEARAMAGWLARESGCVTLSSIAKLVNRDVGSISSAVRRLSDRVQDDPVLAEKMRSLQITMQGET
ncbi:MAG: transposase [Desulfobulbaceae bacterium DB1]|nr:MAG: transposase [Desulfobulbaceae bacterium DB1]